MDFLDNLRSIDGNLAQVRGLVTKLARFQFVESEYGVVPHEIDSITLKPMNHSDTQALGYAARPVCYSSVIRLKDGDERTLHGVNLKLFLDEGFKQEQDRHV